MHWHRWALLGLWGLTVQFAQAACTDEALDPGVRSGPVRLMVHVDADALLPSAPQAAGSPFVGGAAGAPAGAVILGNVLGQLFINRMNISQQDAAASKSQWVKTSLDRLDLSGLLYASLSRGLTSGGFADVHIEAGADSLDMEQPGLLARIAEPHTVTAHVSYGWTRDNDRLAWARMYLRVWTKGRYQPTYCREYVYLGGGALSMDASSPDSMSIEQMINESMAEFSLMVGLDPLANLPAVAGPVKPLNLHAVLPVIGDERQWGDVVLKPVSERPERWVASGDGERAKRWWSLPRTYVQAQD